MVDPAISKALVDAELVDVLPFAQELGWDVQRVDDLTVSVTMAARKLQDIVERFVFEFHCDDYAAKPPIIDVVHPITAARNQPNCFPIGHGYFHGKARICAGWSRRAYKEEFADGPHEDFKCATWKEHAEGVTTLPLMLQELWKALYDNSYGGRDS